MINNQIIFPMCRLRFPRFDVPCPSFKRKLFESRDTDTERLNMEQIRMMKEMGLPMNVDEVYERIGMTMPERFTEDVIGMPGDAEVNNDE